MNGLIVSEVAKQAGVNVETLRFYERRKVLPTPPRTDANYRIYSEETVRRLRFIKRAQDLGFSLREIQELLSLRASPRAKCATIYTQAQEKIQDIDQKIKTLRSMRQALAKLMRECQARGPISACPILEALDDKEASS